MYNWLKKIHSNSTVMDKTSIENLTRELMNQFGLHDWGFKWCWTKRSGCCAINRKVIMISGVMIGGGIDDVDNLIRHEIAHALQRKPSIAHGEEFLEACKLTGCDPNRTMSVGVGSRYIATCSVCGRKWHRNQKLRDRFCPCDTKYERELTWEPTT